VRVSSPDEPQAAAKGDHPHQDAALPMPVVPPAGPCLLGDCNEAATGWALDSGRREWLPACNRLHDAGLTVTAGGAA
jgi:hypothetical protein